jgi:hypothetical protein
MRRGHRSGLLVSLVVGMSLAAPVALPLLGGTAAAAEAENNCLLALCSAGAGGNGRGVGGDATAEGGDGGNGGNGGNGGLAAIHDVANADSNASSSVTLDNITTGDATAHQVNVDATGATRPVVVSVAGSFPDTGVDVVAPGGSAQSGTTGGNGLTADASGGAGGDGGNGGDATATGGNGRGTGGEGEGGTNVLAILLGLGIGGAG